MTRVLRMDERLRYLDKPTLNNIECPSLSKDDIYILCAGFEDRAIEVLKRIIDSGQSGFEVLIIQYKPFDPGNKFGEITELCAKNSVVYRCEEYDRENPSSIDHVLYDTCRNKSKVLIDISAMSRLLIVQSVVAVLGRKNLADKTTVIYVEAMKYSPDEKEVEAELSKQRKDSIYRTMFISAGVFDVHIVSELSSVALQGQPVRLITFPSFNIDQLSALRGSLQPTFYSFLHGVPPREENRWRIDAIKKLNHTDEIPQREDYSVSTLSYEETLLCLLDIYAEHGAMERLILSPTGSKMQAVASGVLRAFMKDVQVVYPSPRKFVLPPKYTNGVRALYSLSLAPFSQIFA